MIDQGNLIAAVQKKELSQLESLCESLKASPTLANCSGLSQRQGQMPSEAGHASRPLESSEDPYVARTDMEAVNFGGAWAEQGNEPSEWVRDMSPSQLLEAVDMLNGAELLNWVDLPSGVFDFGSDDVG
jgi:hypothetical protein